ncbi:MAG: Lrp/AsnC family transcriptional regulator [Rhizobiales bacterium]|nr:Lrp/AsnC family transcriptional regulator [Hyphomicrobiales bacterium]
MKYESDRAIKSALFSQDAGCTHASEVQQCYYVTGEADFVLVVVVESMAAYEDFTRRHFFQHRNVKKFRTFVSMDAVKRGTQIAL